MTIFSDRLNLEVMCGQIDEIIKELKSAEKSVKDDTQKNVVQRTKRGLQLLKNMLEGADPEFVTMMTVNSLNTSLQQLEGEVESFKQGRDANALAKRGDAVFHHLPELASVAQANSPEKHYGKLLSEFQETIAAALEEVELTAKAQEALLADLNQQVKSVGDDARSLSEDAQSRIQAVQTSLDTLEANRTALSEKLDSTQAQLAKLEKTSGEFFDKTRQQAEKHQAQRDAELEKWFATQEQRHNELFGRTETTFTEKMNAWSTAFSEGENKRQSEFSKVQNARDSAFAKLTTEFSTQVTEKVTHWDQQLESLHALHEKSFGKESQDRADRVKAQEARWNEKLTEFLAKARAESDKERKEHLEEATRHIEAMTQLEEEARKLVGLIGNTGVTGNYQKIADRELISANWMRSFAIGSIVVLTLLVGFIIWEIGTTDFVWEVMIFRLLAGLPLVGLAWYCGKESSRHRTNEERNRRIELELAALSPYLHQLPDEKAETVRELLTTKYFGNDAVEKDGKNPHLDVSLGTLLKHLEPVVELAKKLK